jgi:L-ribulokinase
MQIYADVTGREIAVAGASQASALGAAMLGAVAAGDGSLTDVVGRMAPRPSRVYRPDERRRREYDVLYQQYKRLYDYFGRGENEVMALLRARRRREN